MVYVVFGCVVVDAYFGGVEVGLGEEFGVVEGEALVEGVSEIVGGAVDSVGDPVTDGGFDDVAVIIVAVIIEKSWSLGRCFR